jgi:hypothetical protein
MFTQDFLDEYKRYRALGEKAMAQVPDDALNRVLTPDGNSIAVIARHVGGNLVSRFTDFLESDGEKPWRDRDSEFEGGPFTRADVDAAWKAGFDIVQREVENLVEDDLTSTVTIRGTALTVHEALCRSLAHVASHVGQIILMARIFAAGEWQTLSIPRGQSAQYNANPAFEKAAAQAAGLSAKSQPR